MVVDDSLPDPDSLEAFICKGDQAVTYGAGEFLSNICETIEVTN